MTTDARRYLNNHHAFRREQLTVNTGELYGGVEEQWQFECIWNPLDERDENDHWRYKLCYLELHRGAAKSWCAAAMGLSVAFLEDSAEIVIAAASKDQAQIIYKHMVGMVNRSPVLKSSVSLGKWEAFFPASNSTIRVISSDAGSSYGLGGTGKLFIAIIDELAQWSNRDLFDSLYSATGKVENWRVLVLSNAGFDKTSVAWETRELARKSDWGYLYSPVGVVASWVTPEWVEIQRSSLPSSVFQRLIENRWSEGSGSLITREMLDTCIDKNWTPQLVGSGRNRHVVGLDLGLTHDRTALVVMHLENGRPTLDYLRVWRGTQREPVNIESVENELLEVSNRFRLRKVLFDPWQLQSSKQRLQGRLPIREFKFTSESVRRLSEALYQSCSTGRLRLFPNSDLENELLNLQAVSTSYGWRVDHKSGGYSDMSMAIGMCLTELLQKTSGGIRSAIRLGTKSELEEIRAKRAISPTVESEQPVEKTYSVCELRLRCTASSTSYIDESGVRRVWYFGDSDWLGENLANKLLTKGDYELMDSRTFEATEVVS